MRATGSRTGIVSPRLPSILFSAAAAALLLFALVDRGRVDGWTLALLGLAALPWFWPFIEKVGFPGGSITFRELKETQEQQGHEIRAIRFVLAHLLSEAERMHLENLASRAPFPLSADTPGPFYDEMRRLRDLGLIRPLSERGITVMRRDGGDVNEYFEITESGREYLALSAAPRGA
jgi:hypothetical protein